MHVLGLCNRSRRCESAGAEQGGCGHHSLIGSPGVRADSVERNMHKESSIICLHLAGRVGKGSVQVSQRR